MLILGDIQYEDGAYSKFLASYDPSWGRVKSITKPVPGNHEYRDRRAPRATTGTSARRPAIPAKGYYSFDLGGWHLVALNSNCSAVGGCGTGSPQEQWLRADLAAHPATCTLAFWHHPRFSSGLHGSDSTYTAFWQALYDANADVVLVGHDHDYERFAPQDGERRPRPRARDPRVRRRDRGEELAHVPARCGPTARRETRTSIGDPRAHARPDGLRVALPCRPSARSPTGLRGCH